MEEGSFIRSVSRSLSKAAANLHMDDVFSMGSSSSRRGRSSHHAVADEEALRWAALEKLPTYNRIRTTILKSYNTPTHELQDKEPSDKLLLDVRELDSQAHQEFIDRVFKDAEEDNGRFLKKFRDRIDK